MRRENVRHIKNEIKDRHRFNCLCLFLEALLKVDTCESSRLAIPLNKIIYSYLKQTQKHIPMSSKQYDMVVQEKKPAHYRICV